MLPYLKDAYGNPQSLHDWGDKAREAIEDARGRKIQIRYFAVRDSAGRYLGCVGVE